MILIIFIIVVISLCLLCSSLIIICIARPNFAKVVCNCSLCSCGLVCFWILMFIILIPLFLLIILFLWLSYLAYLSGDSGFRSFYLFFYTIQKMVDTVVQLWNPISLVVPLIMTIVNIFLKMFYWIIGGILGIACTKLPFDVGFDPVTDCATLWDWLDIIPGLAQIIYNLIQFFLSLIDLLSFSLFPGTCVRDETCARMCSMLGEPAGCFSLQNAITWIFTDNNFWEFLVNNFDFFFGLPLITLIKWLAEQLFILRLVSDCPEYCYASSTAYTDCINDSVCTEITTLFQIVTVIAESNGEIITLFFKALLVQYILSPIDGVICYAVSDAALICLLKRACYFLLTPVALDSFCPTSPCPCQNCIGGWTFLTGDLYPCTMDPSCTCVAAHTILEGLV